MIAAQALTTRYGGTTAVDAIDFTLEPGTVTGSWAERCRQVDDDADGDGLLDPGSDSWRA